MAESSPDEHAALPDDATVQTVAGLNADVATLIDHTDQLTFDYVVGDVTDHRVVNGHVHFDLDEDETAIQRRR